MAYLHGVETVEVTNGARPVEVVDASAGKQLELSVEVPIEDMARLRGATGEGGDCR